MQLRVDIWLHPFAPQNLDRALPADPGLFGMASGGLLGTGLGQGRPDLVPFAQSDFIVAAIGEELGLTGMFALLVLYGMLVRARPAHRASASGTASASCSPPAWRSRWRCRCSSSSAASPG